MLPLLCPILYLPLLEQRKKAKQELPVMLKDFNNSNNQDILYDSSMTNTDTTDLHFNIQNKKALVQELV